MKRVESGIGDALEILVLHRPLPGAVDTDRHERFPVNNQAVMFVNGDGVCGNGAAIAHLNVIRDREKTTFRLHVEQREVNLSGTGRKFAEVAAAKTLVIGGKQFFIPFSAEIECRKNCEILRTGGNRGMDVKRRIVDPK